MGELLTAKQVEKFLALAQDSIDNYKFGEGDASLILAIATIRELCISHSIQHKLIAGLKSSLRSLFDEELVSHEFWCKTTHSESHHADRNWKECDCYLKTVYSLLVEEKS